MLEILESHLRRIERDERGLAVRLFPFTRRGTVSPRIVSIDPLVAYGRPSHHRLPHPTADVADRFKAGESPAIWRRTMTARRKNLRSAPLRTRRGGVDLLSPVFFVDECHWAVQCWRLRSRPTAPTSGSRVPSSPREPGTQIGCLSLGARVGRAHEGPSHSPSRVGSRGARKCACSGLRSDRRRPHRTGAGRGIRPGSAQNSSDLSDIERPSHRRGRRQGRRCSFAAAAAARTVDPVSWVGRGVCLANGRLIRATS